MNKITTRLIRSTNGKLSRFLSDQQGVTAVEYAVMLALLIGVCFVAIQLLGSETASTWNSNSSEIATSMTN